MHTLSRLFLSSDFQCRMLLEHLERRYARGDIDGELRTVVERFAAGVERTQVLDADPDYQAARTDIERLREYLRRDVERATQRDRELGQLRHTAAQVYRLQARIAELEAATPAGGVTDTIADGHPPSPPPARTWAPTAPPALPGLSRQQRRAAQRAATKNR
ncbi:septation ring formation regulator EzrA [Mycobacterium sp. M1]|uniref:Septation ring formation regulator EzrA n=2 Tax=Mycolicibacter acidiphilus TaxID=2835306 RepID=A0ABS5RP22_9MYCO|nr:septation ring formation regulator EzrA [Mycolicibacter acidiphilus]